MAAHGALFHVYLIMWTHMYAPVQASRPTVDVENIIRPTVNVENIISTETGAAATMQSETQDGGAIETWAPAITRPQQSQISLYSSAKGELITSKGMNVSGNGTSLVQKEGTGYYSQRICIGIMISWAGFAAPWLRYEKSFKCGVGLSFGIGVSISYARAMGELVKKGSNQNDALREMNNDGNIKDAAGVQKVMGMIKAGGFEHEAEDRQAKAEKASAACAKSCEWSDRGTKYLFVVGAGLNIAGDLGPWFALVFANLPANPGSASKCYQCMKAQMGIGTADSPAMSDIVNDPTAGPDRRPNLYMVQFIFSLSGAALTLCKRFSLKASFGTKLGVWFGRKGEKKDWSAIENK